MLGWIVGECWNGYVRLKRTEMLGFVGLEWFGVYWIDWMEYVWTKYLGYVRRGMMDWMDGLCMTKWLGYVGLHWSGMLDW